MLQREFHWVNKAPGWRGRATRQDQFCEKRLENLKDASFQVNDVKCAIPLAMVETTRGLFLQTKINCNPNRNK